MSSVGKGRSKPHFSERILDDQYKAPINFFKFALLLEGGGRFPQKNIGVII